MTHQSKVQKVEAFQWKGEDRLQQPKWLQLKSDLVDNSRHLWVNATVGGLVRRGDWVVKYEDESIEIYSDKEFHEQFEEAK